MRESDRANSARVEELETLVSSMREDNDKAWNTVDSLRSEKAEILSEIEEEKAKFVLLKQEMSLQGQESIRQRKDIEREKDKADKRAQDSENRLLHFNREIEKLTRERVRKRFFNNIFLFDILKISRIDLNYFPG